MDTYLKNTYVRVFVVAAVAYVFIVGFYALFVYGSVSISEKSATVYVDNIVQNNSQEIRLRPGTYLVSTATPEYSYKKTIAVFPFVKKTISLEKTDYAAIIKNNLPGGKFFKVSSYQLIDNVWLAASANNDEISRIVVMRFVDGVWMIVDGYTLPESQKSIDMSYFDLKVPLNVSNYIKSELLK